MEWFESPSRRMIMKFSVSVHLIDDLTGLPITGSNARVWIDGQKPPIKKDDGVSIFVDLPDGDYILNAEGGFYARTEYSCSIVEGRYQNITIRLLPNRQYPVPPDIVRIEGKAEPDLTIRVYSSDRNFAYKLLSEAEKGSDVLGIYHNSEENIEGRTLKIISADGKSEYIRIASAKDDDRSEYLLSGKLGSGYPKIGTIIVPVSEHTADDSGNFVIMIKRNSGSEFIMEYQKKKRTVRKEIVISDSNNIKTDLT